MAEDAGTPAFESQLLALMSELVTAHRLGSAALVSSERGSDKFLTVIPLNDKAATIHLHFYGDGGLVDFCFGNMCAPFELDDENYMERLRELSEAVIQGRCGEVKGWLSKVSWLEPLTVPRSYTRATVRQHAVHPSRHAVKTLVRRSADFREACRFRLWRISLATRAPRAAPAAPSRCS